MSNSLQPPFSLEGGRVGDGGVARSTDQRPTRGGVIRARRFRKQPTVAERILWTELRKLDKNFRRQVPIGRYVADLAHHGSRVIIELDGYYHTLPDRAEQDAARTTWLNAASYRVIRFEEAAVRNDVQAVIEAILAATVTPPSPTLPPSREKGEESTRA